MSLCQLLLIAGFETAVNLVGSAVHLLLDHPDQWTALVADPDLATGAVEETLRHQSPVQATTRIAREDVELARQHLPAGSIVMLLLGATLARAEGAVALRALAERMPELRRAGPPQLSAGSCAAPADNTPPTCPMLFDLSDAIPGVVTAHHPPEASHPPSTTSELPVT